MFNNRTPQGYQSGSQQGRIRDQNIYVGFIKRNDDAQRMGRISVWIPEIGGDPQQESSWIIVRYASPFAGATDARSVKSSQTDGQQSYGFWMQPPDLNNEVLVCFANGDLARGFCFACLWQQNMDHMIPGIASNIPTDPNKKSDGTLPPVTEYNRQSVQSTEEPARPVFTPLDNGLRTEGLSKDFERGPSSSSVRREAPSKVFGWLTPRGNQVYVDDNVDNEFIRFRTRSGAQILIHETTGYVYINSANGNSWFEISDAGIDGYSSQSISLRSEKDFNIRADKNIIFDAGANISMRAGQSIFEIAGKDIGIGSAQKMKISAGTTMNIQSEGAFSVKSNATLIYDASGNISIKGGGDITTGASGAINSTAGGVNARFGSTVTDNTGSGPSPSSAADDPATGPLGTSQPDVTFSGQNISAKTSNSTVSRMPTHEPWVGHPRRDVPDANGNSKPPYPASGVPTGEGNKTVDGNNDGCPIGVGAKTASNELFGAMQEGSSKTGLPLDLIMGVGDIESGFKSQTSPTGAAGPFQIVGGTYSGLVSRYGNTDNVGMGDASTDRGSALMGARYLAEQKATLQRNGIANPTYGQIYGMYNAGPGAFQNLLKADPSASAASVVGPTVANNNRSFYFDKDGNPLTVAQTLQTYDTKVASTAANYTTQAGQPPPCARGSGSGSVAGPATGAGASYLGGPPVGSGQCVALVQQATGVGNTGTWQQGAQVVGNGDLQPGTAIATFDSNGRYGNHTDGSSHAAIYQSTNPDGSINVIDQWSGQPPHQRTIQINNSKVGADNANRYYVINTPPKV